jgi:hypothetical protein
MTGDCRVSEAIRADIERHSQYSTADVTTDCLGVDQVCGSDRHTNADVGAKMDVRHYRNVLHVCRAAKTFNRFSDVALKWVNQPRM